MLIILIFVLITLLFSLPAVQTKMARYATNSINEQFGTNINIGRIQFSPFNFNTSIKDLYVEDYKADTLLFVEKVNTSVLNLRNMIDGSHLEFGAFELYGLQMNMKTYEGAQLTNLDVFIEKLDDGQQRDPLKPPFYMSSSQIEIIDSRFQLIDENLAEPSILDFPELNINADNFIIFGSQVKLNITDLNFDNFRGLQLNHLSTSFTYTKKLMRFNNLIIETPNSNLKGKLAFRYNREDFKDFLNAVELRGNFSESTISFNDINLFYNQFGADKNVSFKGELSGYLNNLKATNLDLDSEITKVKGTFTFSNMFSEEAPFIMNGDMQKVTSSYYELRSLMPNILGERIPASLKKLGQFSIRGNAEVTETSLDAQINIATALGDGFTDLQMTNMNVLEDASYIGQITLDEFDLGTFVENPKFGKTSLNLNVEGRGFLAEYLNTQAIGDISNLEFNGYEYTNIKVSGILQNQLFDGNLLVNDRNLRLDFRGLANFSETKNEFNFIADVDYADFKKMNFINDSISIFRGNVKMDITGNSLDNISGEIDFTDTAYQNKNDVYFFEDFKITSSFQGDSIRDVTINSPDIITGYMRGKFKIGELDKLVQNSVGSIYTNYQPFEISSGQNISFNFKIYNKIVGIFFPEVSFGPETFIRGKIVSDEQDFKLTFQSPEIDALENNLKGVELQIDNKNPLFNTFLSVEDMKTVYYDVKDFNLINTTIKDTLFFRTEFKGGSKYNDEYNLNFYHTFDEKRNSVIGLKPSDVSFKGNTWLLNQSNNQQNKLIINPSFDSLSIKEVVMDNLNNERIKLSGDIVDSTYKDLKLEFDLVSLNKVTPEIDSLKLDGKVDGILNVLQKDGQYLPSSSLEITNFSVNNLILGDVEMMIFGNDDLTEYNANMWLNYQGQERFGMSGKIFDSDTETTLDLLATFEDFSLEPLAPLGEEIISNIRGLLSGSARITGNARNPEINGSLTMNNGGLGIPYLNVDYDFSPLSRIRLFGQTFLFEQIGLTDTKSQTTAVLDGSISHTEFDDWTFDLNVDANQGRFLILDTEFEEEVLYYGTGYVSGKGAIYGTVNALNIDFEGATAEGTSLKIPLSDLTSVGDYSFINFINKNEVESFEEERVLDNYEGLELFFDLDVTPEAEVQIVIDQQSGSSLKGTGEGLLLMEINTNGKFNMYGQFVVVTGQYNFKRAGVIDKTFTVRPGGEIIWDGEPLDAQLNLEAVYALNANPAPLLDNPGYQSRIPTEVVVRLDGELESPNIEFDIDFPGTSSVVKSELEYRLQDPTIKSNNAFYLLAQGTFVDESSGLNQQAVTGNLIQTASGLLNSVLTGENDKLNFGLSYEQGYTDLATDLSTENRLGVTVSTQLSDRVLVNGKVGVPVGGVSETVVAGDVEVQVILNDEGTLSAKIFNRQNQIRQFLSERQGYTQGVGLSYQVDFNSFRGLLQQLFGKKNKQEEVREEELKANAVMGKDSLIQFYSKTSSSQQ